MTTNGTFNYDDINSIVNGIKQLTDEEVDELVKLAIENDLTEDPDGLLQTFQDMRSGRL